jgi:hypothetical protein
MKAEIRMPEKEMLRENFTPARKRIAFLILISAAGF